MRSGEVGSHSFNPHHNGYGLEAGPSPTQRAARKVSILIIMDTGWKPTGCSSNTCKSGSFNPHHNGYRLEDALYTFLPYLITCFNPHHNGYGLEANSCSLLPFLFCIVSILIIMDTGWKPMAKKSGNTKKPVSILIIMDTGWKPDTSLQSIITEIGFNPHHNGYGLEVLCIYFLDWSHLFQSSS